MIKPAGPPLSEPVGQKKSKTLYISGDRQEHDRLQSEGLAVAYLTDAISDASDLKDLHGRSIVFRKSANIDNSLLQKLKKSKKFRSVRLESSSDLRLSDFVEIRDGKVEAVKSTDGEKCEIQLDGNVSTSGNVPEGTIFVSNTSDREPGIIHLTRRANEYLDLKKRNISVELYSGKITKETDFSHLADYRLIVHDEIDRETIMAIKHPGGLQQSTGNRRDPSYLSRLNPDVTRLEYQPSEGVRIAQIIMQRLNEPVVTENGEVNLFLRNGQYVEVTQINGKPEIRVVSRERLVQIISYIFIFTNSMEEEIYRDLEIPKKVIDNILADPHKSNARQIASVSNSPFIRPDGTIVQTSGYDRQTKTYLAISEEYPGVPEEPTLEDAKKSWGLIDSYIADYSWKDPKIDKAAWLSMLLSFVARHAIDGNIPAFLSVANKKGVGKSAIIELAITIAWGREYISGQTYTNDRKELSNLIYSFLSGGSPILFFDNVAQSFGNEVLDQYLTIPRTSVRLMMTQKASEALETRMIIAASGNGMRFQGDIDRRAILIEQFTNHPNPHSIRHERDIEHEVYCNRKALLVAALTILRAYSLHRTESGRPDDKVMNKFGGWVGMVRDAVVWLGIGDPLDTLDRVKDRSGAVGLEIAMIHYLQAKGAFTEQESEKPKLICATEILTDIDTASKPSSNSLYDYDRPEGELLDTILTLSDALAETCGNHKKLTTQHIGRKLNEIVDSPVDTQDGYNSSVAYGKSNKRGYYVKKMATRESDPAPVLEPEYDPDLYY